MTNLKLFPTLRTIDADGAFRPQSTASYLLREGDELAIVEASTSLATPRILQAVRETGLPPEAVQFVIITHVHLDHAGGAWKLMEAFPNAVCFAHPRAAKHLIDPARLLSSARSVYGEPLFAKLFGEMRGIPSSRVREMQDGEILAWGSRTLAFPYARGHANHHFLVHDSRENVAFTGDSFGLIYPSMQGPSMQGLSTQTSDGHPPLFAYPTTTPIDFDAEEALRTVDRIEAMGLRAVGPTHFGLETRVTEAASQLRVHLRFLASLDGSRSEGELVSAQEQHLNAWFSENGARWGEEEKEWMRPDLLLNSQGLKAACART